MIKCACGCGQLIIQYNKWGYKRKYIHGHNKSMLGRHHSKKTRDKISSAQYKGIKTNEAGYVLIHCPKHPFADSLGYVKRSRLVMEKHLGRYLKPEETVHHKKKKDDDRIKYLKLFKTTGKHTAFHHNILKDNVGFKHGGTPWNKGKKLIK